VTGTSDVDRTDLRGGRSRSALGFGLNFLGIAVVAFWLVSNGIRAHYPPVVLVLGGLSLAGWAVREVSADLRVRVAVSIAMVVFGAAAVVGSDSLLIVPVIVGVVLLQATTALPVWVGVVAALVATIEIALAATVLGAPTPLWIGSLGGLVLGVLIGFSRRQARFAEEQRIEMVEEQRRVALLAEKSRAARDIHDVLAHSLGGLVLQLDAVEALLEADRVDEATARAGDARRLAADGLAEARRAVAALREDPTPDLAAPRTEPSGADAPRASRPDPTPQTLTDLVDAHRAFGGTIRVEGDTSLPGLDDRHVAAVVRTSREALSNARKHAPGRPVVLSVTSGRGALDVAIANELLPDGHGIVGMHERFAELGDGSRVEAGRVDDRFVVAMHVPGAGATS
jgi:signal transduction histidine kinase